MLETFVRGWHRQVSFLNEADDVTLKVIFVMSGFCCLGLLLFWVFSLLCWLLRLLIVKLDECVRELFNVIGAASCHLLKLGRPDIEAG
jgi:hypothetical protein